MPTALFDERLGRVLEDFAGAELCVIASTDPHTQWTICSILKEEEMAFVRIVGVVEGGTSGACEPDCKELSAVLVLNGHRKRYARLPAFCATIKSLLKRQSLEPIMINGYGTGPAKLIDLGTNTRLRVYPTLGDSLIDFFAIVGREAFYLRAVRHQKDCYQGSGWMNDLASRASGEIV